MVADRRPGRDELPFPVPANARVAGFLPYADAAPAVDVMVTNGGWGGTLAALSHGIPLVIARRRPRQAGGRGAGRMVGRRRESHDRYADGGQVAPGFDRRDRRRRRTGMPPPAWAQQLAGGPAAAARALLAAKLLESAVLADRAPRTIAEFSGPRRRETPRTPGEGRRVSRTPYAVISAVSATLTPGELLDQCRRRGAPPRTAPRSRRARAARPCDGGADA